MGTVTPIVSTDMPTRRLMLALEEAGWLVAKIYLAYADLRSPDRRHRMVVKVSTDQPDRVEKVWIDEVPLTIAEATVFVKANGAT